MYFSSFNELLTMDGHGGYVWVAYLATLAVLVLNFIAVRVSTKSQQRALRWRHEAQSLNGELTQKPSEHHL